MSIGRFEDKKHEYLITKPSTHLPWVNYLGCESYFGVISNTVGGYSFYHNAGLRRLTHYRNNRASLLISEDDILSER